MSQKVGFTPVRNVGINGARIDQKGDSFLMRSESKVTQYRHHYKPLTYLPWYKQCYDD